MCKLNESGLVEPLLLEASNPYERVEDSADED
jgi:hypothetical protein